MSAAVDSAINYFAADPLKLLYLFGVAGGIWFWIEKWLDRIRLRVRMVGHWCDLVPPNGLKVSAQFEVENIGKTATSLKPLVTFAGYNLERMRMSAILEIADGDRFLPPHSPKIITVVGRIGATYARCPFKSFRFSPTRGCARVVYSRTEPRANISWLRYNFEVTMYRSFGRLPASRTDRSDG